MRSQEPRRGSRQMATSARSLARPQSNVGGPGVADPQAKPSVAGGRGCGCGCGCGCGGGGGGARGRAGAVALLERSGEAVERVLEGWPVRVNHKPRGEAELRKPIMDGARIVNRPDDALELSIFPDADYNCSALRLSRGGALQHESGQ